MNYLQQGVIFINALFLQAFLGCQKIKDLTMRGVFPVDPKSFQE